MILTCGWQSPRSIGKCLIRCWQIFEFTPDYDLNMMLPGQTLTASTSRILAALEPVIADARPEIVLCSG